MSQWELNVSPHTCDRTTQLGVLNMNTGDIRPVGTSFPSQWTQVSPLLPPLAD